MAKYKIGDVFSIKKKNNDYRFFQYISDDSTQLNSNVIRVFKKEISNIDNIDLNNIINNETDFYAHVMLKLGEKLKVWEKIGNFDFKNEYDIIFRNSSDYGEPDIKISENWWIWKINEKEKFVGKLTNNYKNSEIGIVVTPFDIVQRIETGNYQFVYPDY